jgi:hypothetical protein
MSNNDISINTFVDKNKLDYSINSSQSTKLHNLNNSIESSDIYINRCIICKIDLGEMNPRQYCEKWYCPFEEYINYSSDENQCINDSDEELANNFNLSKKNKKRKGDKLESDISKISKK